MKRSVGPSPLCRRIVRIRTIRASACKRKQRRSILNGSIGSIEVRHPRSREVACVQTHYQARAYIVLFEVGAKVAVDGMAEAAREASEIIVDSHLEIKMLNGILVHEIRYGHACKIAMWVPVYGASSRGVVVQKGGKVNIRSGDTWRAIPLGVAARCCQVDVLHPTAVEARSCNAHSVPVRPGRVPDPMRPLVIRCQV